MARRRPGLRRPARHRAAGRSELDRRRRLTRPCGSATAPASTATGSPAMREMLDGGELDVLTGDYLAELTMLILGRDRLKDPALGYAKTFLRQLRTASALALERGVRIVANAGGLNPAGLADALGELADRLGLPPASPTSKATTCAATGELVGRADRERLPGRVRHRRVPATRAPTSWSPAGSPTPRWWSARRSRTSAGRATTGTRWPGRPWPGTCSSAAPRPPAATSRVFLELHRPAAARASRSRRSPPTARR